MSERIQQVIEALGRYEPCDEDGSVCVANRLAVDEARAMLGELVVPADGETPETDSIESIFDLRDHAERLEQQRNSALLQLMEIDNDRRAIDSNCDYWHRHANSIAIRLAESELSRNALAAEAERLREDAERYRIIRIYPSVVSKTLPSSYQLFWWGDELDAAIDSARAAP